MKYSVLSCSLRKDSRSAIMAKYAFERLQQSNYDTSYHNLSNYDLPICDAGDCYSHPKVLELSQEIKSTDGIIFATPVYNFNVSASAKNLLELTGESWNEKVVGFICAAGGRGSYMAVMSFANSLMLDFRCVIIPRFVFATDKVFNGDQIIEPAIRERIEELCQNLVRFTKALR